MSGSIHTIYPPVQLQGKFLKSWYRMKMREFTGSPDLPDEWMNRPGLRVETKTITVVTMITIHTYEKWDMSDELVKYPLRPRNPFRNDLGFGGVL